MLKLKPELLNDIRKSFNIFIEYKKKHERRHTDVLHEFKCVNF